MKKLAFLLTLALMSPFASAVKVGDKAPNFVLNGLETKRKISLKAYRGKVVYLDFWASWCGPCRTSLPLLNEMRKDLKKRGFEVLAVNLDEDGADGLEFLKEFPVTYPTLADPKGQTPEVYKIKGMPTSFLIDRRGKVVKVHEGFRKSDIKEIRSQVEKLLAKR